MQSYPELRLHFAGLIANVINSVPRGQGRVLLFTPVSRQSLFYLFANWCGLFGQRVDVDVRSRNPQLSYNSLQAMSALLCCGPVFQANGLDKSSAIYRWLDNMLNCGEARVGWPCGCCLRCPELPVLVLHRCGLSAARPCNCCCTTTAALPLSCTGSSTGAMTARLLPPSSASMPSPTQLPACGWLWHRLGRCGDSFLLPLPTVLTTHVTWSLSSTWCSSKQVTLSTQQEKGPPNSSSCWTGGSWQRMATLAQSCGAV